MSEPPRTPDVPTAPQPPPGGGQSSGDVLGDRYVLREVLGQGGMATVWRAHDPVLHRDVAIKIFQHTAAVPDASARAVVEVRMLAGLNHPHLVSVHDAAGSAPGRFDHLVMEFVDGASLRQRLDAGPLPADRTAALGVELASGLEYVHDRGIVHRDLKPANILLERTSRGDRAKIADFGVARLLEGVALTMDGTTVGTANYLSPEQATGSAVEPSSDIYSLGLVLLECLTGVMAFPGHGVAAAAARLHRPPEIPASLPAGWHDLLTSMTALDPAARPDAARVGTALRRLTTTADSSTVVLPAVAPAERTAVLAAGPVPDVGTAVLPVEGRRRRRGLLVAIGLVVAAIVVLGLVIGLGGGSDGTGPADGGPSAPATTSTVAPPSTTPTRSSTSPSARPSTSAASTRRTSSSAVPAPPGPPKKKDPKPGKDKGGPPGRDKP